MVNYAPLASASPYPPIPEKSRLLDMFTDPVRGIAFSLAFLLLTVYGMSAILFLTQTLIRSVPPYDDADLIRVLSSLLSAVVALGILAVFVNVEKQLSTNALKYLTLFVLTCLVTLGVQKLMWVYALKHLLQHPSPNHFQQSAMYLFSPAIAVCLYFYSWQRSNSFSRIIRRQEYELVRLAQLKTQAELTALQARINPHFLYNTLNSISSLVYKHPDKADEMVVELSKLFQATTNASSRLVAPITDEVNFVNGYLRIEQYRFGDRLQYALEVDPDVGKVEIPRFLLQPLVENAVKHGISNQLGVGHILVFIGREGQYLQIKVRDNGAPFPGQAVNGYGLTSIHETLRLLYEGRASLTLQNTPDKQVFIRIPL
jgi:two-component system LytT family sensor kinase